MVRSPLGDEAGPRGAAFVVLVEQFAHDPLAHWIDAGSPTGHPEPTELWA
jgi:hypothetical protein